MKLIWNDHEFKILFIIWHFSMGFYGFQTLFISMKICIVDTEVVMALLVPAESVM